MNVGFAVIPCCVFLKENPIRKNTDGSLVVSYKEFMTYLQEKCLKKGALRLKESYLPFTGKNRSLNWHPSY